VLSRKCIGLVIETLQSVSMYQLLMKLFSKFTVYLQSKDSVQAMPVPEQQRKYLHFPKPSNSPPSTHSQLTMMSKLINIIPQNLHLHLLQIVILRCIHPAIRLIALIIRLLPIIPPLLAAALPAATAHPE